MVVVLSLWKPSSSCPSSRALENEVSVRGHFTVVMESGCWTMVHSVLCLEQERNLKVNGSTCYHEDFMRRGLIQNLPNLVSPHS